MNWKTLGDIAQNCAIGELSKFGLGVAMPLSDNYPFDLIVIAGTKLFKVQVKGSSMDGSVPNAVTFSMKRTNFYNGERKTYAKNDVDVYGLYDFKRNILHLIPYSDVNESISIRYDEVKNKNSGKYNFAKNTQITQQRVKDVFDFDVPDFSTIRSKFIRNKYSCICECCGNEFKSSRKTARFCGNDCRGEFFRKVPRPSKDVLKIDIETLPFVQIGAKYGVSDNSIRKWAKIYGLL